LSAKRDRVIAPGERSEPGEPEIEKKSPRKRAKDSVARAGSTKKETCGSVQTLIHEIRGQRVMLDSDLARIYGGAVKALNQAVKRNAARFPEDSHFVSREMSLIL
jgi:hypothetical protein